MNANELTALLTTENVIYILKQLGSTHIDKSEFGHILFQTVCHCGSKHKLYYYIESKKFHCYTNCGQLSIYDVIMSAKNMSFLQAKSYIHTLLGIENTHTVETYLPQVSNNLEILDMYDSLGNEYTSDELKVYPDTVMKLFSDIYYTGWVEEGITIETMRKFNIKYYALQHAIIIPHYNAEGGLVGIRRRSLDPIEVERGGKYMPIQIEGVWYTHPLQFNLYGLNFNKSYIERTKKLIIVESEKGVMQLDSMFPNGSPVVALSSSNLSNAQVDMIINLGVEEVIFALDKQYQEPFTDEYKKYQKKILKLVRKLTTFVSVSIMWDTKGLLGYKDSPTDRGREVFEQLYRTRISITN